MSDLDDVYAVRSINEDTQEVQRAHQDEEIEVADTGADGSTPEQVTTAEETIVDWRAKAEEAERRSQELERKARGLEQAIAATRQKVREQPAFNDNPAEYVEQLRNEFSQQVHLVRVESMQAAARARYADYDEKEAVFAKLADQNPYLVAQLRQAQDPAEFAYKAAEYHIAMESAGGSLDALKKQLAAELKAERDQKFESKSQGLPKTLSGATGTGRTSAQTFTGPTNLSDIYKR